MAVGDPSREDAAADAVARAVWPGALAGAALVDDHRVARDAAGVGVGADGERDSSDLQARVHVVRRGLAIPVAVPDRAVRASPRVRRDVALRHGCFVVVAALGLRAVAGSAGVDVEAAGLVRQEVLELAAEDDPSPTLILPRAGGERAHGDRLCNSRLF